MREPVDQRKLRTFLERLGDAVTGRGRVYLTGGATALSYGWRPQTIDIDVRLDPEPPGAFTAIARLKDELDVNVELASPIDFLPAVPGWQDRSVYLGSFGSIDVYHFDPVSQVLSKLARGFDRDLRDADAMAQAGLVDGEQIARAFEAISPDLIRFPRLDADSLAARVHAFADRYRPGSP